MTPEDRIKLYLNQNRSKLQFATSLDAVVGQVKLFVFMGSIPPPDDQIRKIVSEWAMFNAIGILIRPSVTNPSPAGPSDPPPSNSDLVDAVKKAITTIGAGVTIGKDGANINLKVTGATANLKLGDTELSVGSSWGGTVKMQVENGPFHFSGEIGSDKWELSLTFPSDDAVPNLSTLPTVFKEGENAARNVARAASTYKDGGDLRAISAQIKPDIAKLQTAVDAVSGIASAPKKGGWSFGFKVGSPDPMPGDKGMPKGVEGSFVIAWIF